MKLGPGSSVAENSGKPMVTGEATGHHGGVKHAGASAFARLSTLLSELRALDGLREKSVGTFYRGGRAFLHFHDDPSGLYADVRLDGGDWSRLRVSTRTEQRALVRAVRQALGTATR